MSKAKSEADQPRNLFGDPVQAQQRGRGRPAFEWTLERSNKVLLAFAAGRSKAEAAIAVGCSVRTLEKVFSAELAWRKAAALRLEAEQMNRLNEAAKGGNVGAEKELRKMLEAARHESAATAYAKAPAKAKPEKLGKKEQRAAEALSAHEGSTWGDLVGANEDEAPRPTVN